MIKIAICDDEQYIRSYLSSLIQKQDYETEITEYASADAYLSAGAEYDLLFLDIELDACPADDCFPNQQSTNAHTSEKRLNGMELARRIRTMAPNRQPLIIFVTGHEKYACSAFDVDAFQYLLKPVNEERFSEIFRRVAEQIVSKTGHQQKKLVIQYAGTSRVLPLDDIYYMESQGHKIVLHLKDTTLEYYAKLGDLEQALSGQFSRIHKGFLVNLAYVEEYSRTDVTLTNGEKLNLSKYKYDAFAKAHLHFIQASV